MIQWLLSLLLPHQTKTQQEIKDKIDVDLIRQQVEKGTLDMQVLVVRLINSDSIYCQFTLLLKQYSEYIVSLMGRLCSPGRDEKIRELTTLKDVVPLYKGIFEVNTKIVFERVKSLIKS